MTVIPLRKKSISSLHAAAWFLANDGIMIFPCHPGTKIPATEHGFEDASCDLAQVDAWWSKWPDANIGWCPEHNGQVVIDEDAYKKEFKANWFKEYGELSPTHTGKTPRGGRHLYYKGSLPSTTSRLAAGVDTKGVGGYVLLAPSIVFDEETCTTGQYEVVDDRDPAPLPDWVVEAVARKAKKAEALANVELDQPANVVRAIRHLKGLAPTQQDAGSDNKAFQAAAVCRDLGVSLEKTVEIMMEHFKCTPKDRAWIETKVRNAWAHAENEPGAYATPPMTETFGKAVAKLNAKASSRLITRRASEIEVENITWLWPNRLPLGMCSLVAGDGGLGKTTALLDIAARVTRGREWPDRLGRPDPGSVIYFSAEDPTEQVLVPRLMAASADLDKVHFVEAVRGEDDGTRTFALQDDLAELERLVGLIGDVRLIIFDPISSYFGDADTWRNTRVRSVLEPVVRLAARSRVAVIGNTHLAKGSKGRANMRVLDSVAMTATVRSVYQVIQDAEEPERRLFLPSKSNLGPPVDGLSFTIDSKIVDTAKEVSGSHVIWDRDGVSTTADEAFAALDDSNRKDTALGEAEKFLLQILGAGPRSSKDIYEIGRCSGHAEKTVRRAMRSLGVRPSKTGMDGGWVMKLPS